MEKANRVLTGGYFYAGIFSKKREKGGRSMQIYSAMIPVKESFSKKEFVRLVLEWNQGSPCDRMKGVNWDGESYSLCWRDASRMLALEELPEKRIIAARFQKEDIYGMIWTTDLILNLEEKRLSVRLDQETTERTSSFFYHFSPPYFIRMVIRKGYAGMDGRLPVTGEPVALGIGEKELAEAVLLGKEHFQLPVIYVTKKWDGAYPLHVKRLSERLQGTAHVLKETDPKLGELLRKSCDGENPHHGAIGIYYPSASAGKKKIHFEPYTEEILFQKIVNMIYRYENQQTRGPLYLWEDIRMERLRLNHSVLLNNHRKIQEENQDLYEIFEAQLKSQEERIETLTNRVTALSLENQGLHAKMEERQAVPLIYKGSMREFYEGEVRGILLELLEDCLERQEPDTRSQEILKNILEENKKAGRQENRKSRIKRLLKGYSNLSASLKHDLEELGFSVVSEGKHYKLTYFQDPRYTIVMAKSCSDARAGNNLASEIIRKML